MSITYAISQIDEKLKAERKTPWVPEDVAASAKMGATRLIAGVASTDPARFAQLLEPYRRLRQRRIDTYFTDRQVLETKLKDAGVRVIGFAPTTAFAQLAKNVGLIHGMRPDESGSVRVEASAFADIPALAEATAVRSTHIAGSVGIVTGGIAAGLIAGYLPAIGSTGMLASIAIGAIIGGIMLSYASHRWHYSTAGNELRMRARRREHIEMKLARKRFADRQHAVSRLWPDGCEPADGPLMRIALPEAPTEVQENLAAAKRAGLELVLAADSSAIEFAESPAEVFARERRGAYDALQAQEQAERAAKAAERERRRMQAADPIVTTTLGQATAIIVQYGGEFPAEHELIDRIFSDPKNLV